MGASDEKWSRYEDFIAELSRHLDEDVLPEAKPIGLRIQELREARGISLKELAAQVDIPYEMLERIESEAIAPPVGAIVKIARYLQTKPGALIEEEGQKPYSIVRRDERKPVARVASAAATRRSYSYTSLASGVKGRHMESFLVKLEPACPEDEPSIHAGEEFIFVLDGRMSVRLGEETHELEPGDSIYYLSTLPHLVTAAGDKPALILAVIYSAT